MSKFSSTSQDITIEVEPKFEEKTSKNQKSVFVFSYKVLIKNGSQKSIQIKRRSWVIKDAFLNMEYMEGDGIAGGLPIIPPKGEFTYVSYSSLESSFGTIKGQYFAVDEGGKNITISIPEFVLAHPHSIH